MATTIQYRLFSFARALASVISICTIGTVTLVGTAHYAAAGAAAPSVDGSPSSATARGSDGEPPVFHVCPVDPPRHYVDDFGEPRYAAGFHLHQGVDVFAQRGTPVRAPFGGRPEASTNWAGGLAVRVHGKRGFVYHAHLSGLGKLGKVRPGDVVGYVGNSGDALGASTHDHFEWHPGDGPAVDPYRSLEVACRPTHTAATDASVVILRV